MKLLNTKVQQQRQHSHTGVRQPLLNVADRIFNKPLLVQAEKMEVILRGIGPRLFDQQYLGKLQQEGAKLDPEVQAAISMKESAERKPYSITSSGIAIIPVQGTLMKKSTWLSSFSGNSSYERIGAMLETALADRGVQAVVFDIDSPGGETHGAFELSDMIYKARGVKPIYACANDLAASAAYAIASAAEKVWVTRTGMVGSVGVYCMHMDVSQFDAKAGLKYTYIYAGENKVDGNPHEPLSDTALAQFQAEVDRQYSLFINAVSRNRAKTAKAIIDTKARCFSSNNAIPLLADYEGTLEDCIQAMEKRLGITGVSSSVIDMTKPGAQPAAAVDSTGVSADLSAAIVNAAAATAAAASMPADEEDCNTAADPTAIPDDENAAPGTDPDNDGDNDEDENENDDILDDTRIEQPAPDAGAPDQSVTTAANTADNNGQQPEANGQQPKGEQNMNEPKPTPAAPTAAAPSAADVLAVGELCLLAGVDQKATIEYQRKFQAGTLTIDALRKELIDAQASRPGEQVSSGHAPKSNLGALDLIERKAAELATASMGTENPMTEAQAFAKLLAKNPKAYDQYLAQRDNLLDSPGGKRAMVGFLAERWGGGATSETFSEKDVVTIV